MTAVGFYVSKFFISFVLLNFKKKNNKYILNAQDLEKQKI